MGILLTIIAIIISSILVPIGIIYGIIKHLLGINKKALNVALWIDIGGNIFCAELFNDLFIKEVISPFGSPYQTISEVLGINNQLLNMTKLGQVLVNLLHYLDPYHVEKAIGLTVPVVYLSTWEQFKRFSIVVGAILLILTLIVFIAISII
jgi:hypothetical protein